MKLLIDNRENHLIETLRRSSSIFEIKMLDLGDIIIENDDGSIALIIERKTVDDLSASICDNRYREQKTRLIGTVDKTRILYIIEGNITKMTNIKGGTDTLLGSIVNTMYRDGIRVLKTASLDETALVIKKLYSKVDIINSDKDIDIDYACILKKKKKNNMTHRVMFHNTLTLIPQLADKIADVIVEKYSSLSNLIDSYNDIETENGKRKMLKMLEYKIKDDTKIRKIGPVISERVYEFLFGIDSKDEEIIPEITEPNDSDSDELKSPIPAKSKKSIEVKHVRLIP